MPINLGANLPTVHDWQGTNIFTNLMKQSRGLSSFDDPAEVPATIPQDANGYPLAAFGVVVKSPLRTGDDGEYQIKFKGKARVSALPNAITVVNQRMENDWQVADLTIPPAALSTLPGYKEPILMLRFHDLQDEAVRDISLVKKSLLEADGTAPTFHPVWVEHLRRFRTIRLMNWMSYWLPIPQMNWADRPKKDRLTQADTADFEVEMVRGVAPEYITELATILKCDVWLNIPPLATDDYVTGLARMMKRDLPATSKVYLEYGNEMWATGSHTEATWQGNYNLREAREEIKAGKSNLQKAGENEAEHQPLWAMRRYARRTKEIGDIFVGIFGSRSRNSRIRPVYCYQSVNPSNSLLPGLEFLESQYGRIASAIWGISPKTAVDEGMPSSPQVDDVLRSMNEGLAALIGGHPARDSQTPLLEQAAATAAWHGVAFALYEGGIGLSRTDQVPAEVAFDMMRHRWEIYDLCYRYLQAWFSYGNDNLLCWFIAGASDWGGIAGGPPDIHGLTWTVQEQNTMPIRALDAALARGDFEVTVGLAVPGRVDTRRHVERAADWERSLRNDRTWQSDDRLYLLNAPSAKSYAFQLVSERNTDAETTTEVWINNKKITTIIIPPGIGSHTSAVFKASLRKGMNALKMIYSDGTLGNYHLMVK